MKSQQTKLLLHLVFTCFRTRLQIPDVSRNSHKASCDKTKYMSKTELRKVIETRIIEQQADGYIEISDDLSPLIQRDLLGKGYEILNSPKVLDMNPPIRISYIVWDRTKLPAQNSTSVLSEQSMSQSKLFNRDIVT